MSALNEILEQAVRNWWLRQLRPPGSPERPITIPDRQPLSPRRMPRRDPTQQPPSSVPPPVFVDFPPTRPPSAPVAVDLPPPRPAAQPIAPLRQPPVMPPDYRPPFVPPDASPPPGYRPSFIPPQHRSPHASAPEPIEIPPPPGGWGSQRQQPATPERPPSTGPLMRLAPLAIGAGILAADAPRGPGGSGEIPPPPPPTPPEEPRQPASAPATTPTQTLQEMLLQEALRILQGSGTGSGPPTPQTITPDMLPNWQAVRDAMAAAAPEAPRQISDEDRWRNVLLAFLGNFSWRPGERIGSALARQGGAAVGERLSIDERNRQLADMFRREQQAHRLASAQTELQAQTGQFNALSQMIQANNAAQIAAFNAGRMSDFNRLQALGLLLRSAAQQHSVSPEYIASRLISEVSRSGGTFTVPGLDYQRARQAAIASLSPQARAILQSNVVQNPAIVDELNRAIAFQLFMQLAGLPPEVRANILRDYSALATQRPRANATVLDE